MTNNYTLYYPTIEFKNPAWLWSAALIWDRVYRIVPSEYNPRDSRNIRELIDSSDFVTNIDPLVYSHEACNQFIAGCKKETWWAAALDNANYKKEEYIKMHKDKADVKLREMILAEDLGTDWLRVPGDIASIYMLYLANFIAKKNDISLSTDYPEAWCGSNFFQHDGNISDYENESLTQLACMTMSNFIPENILDIPPAELAKFRERRKDERNRFYTSIQNLGEKLSTCSDERIILDIIHDYRKEIETSINEYKKSMIDIKATRFIGVKSMLIPVVKSVMDEFYTMPEELSKGLALAGLGVGVIGAFWETRKAINEKRKHFEYDYLLQLDKLKSRSYTHDFHNNIHTEYQLYLADNLNHFLRD